MWSSQYTSLISSLLARCIPKVFIVNSSCVVSRTCRLNPLKFVARRFKVKVKFSHTRYRAMSPELILVYRQSAHRWLFKSSPEVGCHYFPPDLRSPSQPKDVTVLRPVPSYTVWWQKNIGVNNLPKVVMQLCSGGNWTYDLLIASSTPCSYTTSVRVHIKPGFSFIRTGLSC